MQIHINKIQKLNSYFCSFSGEKSNIGFWYEKEKQAVAKTELAVKIRMTVIFDSGEATCGEDKDEDGGGLRRC